MKKVLVVSPHADDETLGCGGTLLRHKSEGCNIHWIIVSGISETEGYSAEMVVSRSNEIQKVAKMYGFDSVYNLGFPTAKLDTIPMQVLVESLRHLIKKIQPDILYLPYCGDVHTDHEVVFKACISCIKWFRGFNISRILAYETLSETEFGLSPNSTFRPNVYVNISQFLADKLAIMKVYQSEIGSFPFPRSEQAITALAQIRGSVSGFEAAEGFILLKETI
jgi:LmbE family N-acetylglucosaminyl deacetylase